MFTSAVFYFYETNKICLSKAADLPNLLVLPPKNYMLSLAPYGLAPGLLGRAFFFDQECPKAGQGPYFSPRCKIVLAENPQINESDRLSIWLACFQHS